MNPINANAANQDMYKTTDQGSAALQIEYKTTTNATTSQAMQEAWTEQVTIIDEIMKKDPDQITAQDLDDLIAALDKLKDLAENGITDANGKTTYMNSRMTERVDALFTEFDKVGIRPGMDLDAMSASEKEALLKGAKNDSLTGAVKDVSKTKYDNLPLQAYLYSVMMYESFPAYGNEVNNLSDWMKLAQELIETLTGLKDYNTDEYLLIVKDWGWDKNLSNPAAIPPDAVPAIRDYMNKVDKGKGDAFEAQYNAELKAAEEAAKKNGTTVQEEMAKVKVGSKSSNQMLKEFMQAGGTKDNTRAADIEKILSDTVAREVRTVPRLPDGKTWEDVTNDLLEFKKQIEDALAEMERLGGGDPKLVASLNAVVKGIDDAFNAAGPAPTPIVSVEKVQTGQTRGGGGIVGAEPKPIYSYYIKEEINGEIVQRQISVDEYNSYLSKQGPGNSFDNYNKTQSDNYYQKIATKYIEDNKTGSLTNPKGATTIDEALTRTMTRSEADQKEHKRLSTELDQMIQATGSMMEKLTESQRNIFKATGR